MPQFDLFELFHQFFFVFWSFVYLFLVVEGYILPRVFKFMLSRRFCTAVLFDLYKLKLTLLSERSNMNIICLVGGLNKIIKHC